MCRKGPHRGVLRQDYPQQETWPTRETERGWPQGELGRPAGNGTDRMKSSRTPSPRSVFQMQRAGQRVPPPTTPADGSRLQVTGAHGPPPPHLREQMMHHLPCVQKGVEASPARTRMPGRLAVEEWRAGVDRAQMGCLPCLWESQPGQHPGHPKGYQEQAAPPGRSLRQTEQA